MKDIFRCQWQDIRVNGVESAASQTAKELVGPLRSSAVFAANRVSRGRLFPGASIYFDRPKVIEHDKAWEQLPMVVGQIVEKVESSGKRPDNFIGKDLYADWISAKASLSEKLTEVAGGGIGITDYVVSAGDSHILFYTRSEGDKEYLYPLLIGSKIGRDSLKQQLVQPLAREELHPIEPGEDAALANNLDTENAIESIHDQLGIFPEDIILRLISPITNEFPAQRHVQYERDGEQIRRLRRMGAYSIGELQDLQMALMQKTLIFDQEKGGVRYDSDLERIWTKVWLQANPDAAKEAAEEEFEKFAREKVYYELVVKWLLENHQPVTAFRNSSVYKDHAESFKDRNLSTAGLTETQIASHMLANYYLYRFEGSDTPEDSPSQQYLASIENFHRDIAAFLNRKDVNSLEFPAVVARNRYAAVSQREALRKIAGELQELPYQNIYIDIEEKRRIVTQAESALERVQHEISRHESTKPIAERLGLIRGTDTKLIHAVVANMSLARVSEERRFTVSSWFPYADGYMPEGSGIFPFEKEQKFDSIENAVRHVFNGRTQEMGDGGSSDSAYESQVARIYETGDQILDFLQTDQRVPQRVREFIGIILSPKDLKVKLLEVFGHVGEQDPLIVNRFFPEGFDEFQIMTTHRYVTDFLRGVESQLVKSAMPNSDKLRRRFKGNWKNYDFSNVDEETLQQAIDQTLAIGEHRIKKLDHEIGENKTTLKDWQELFEKMFGWDTHEMKFLRWESFWDVWNSLGPAWDCICFLRKPIFNAHTIQQY